MSSTASSTLVERVLADIEASPTPYHAAERAAERLAAAGFERVAHEASLPSAAGRYVTVRAGACLAWIQPEPGRPLAGYCIVGAHTDSPNLRLRANAEVSSAGWAQLGVEVYGGILANSWLDRDLGLAGRVVVADGSSPGGLRDVLVRDDSPVLRIPQLAIHLDREIREKGLLLDPQRHLTPLWAVDDSNGPDLQDYLGSLAGAEPESIVSWELMAYDTVPPAVVGRDRDLISSARIDNQFSCFAAVEALLAVAGDADDRAARIPVMALYDHEEVGSGSAYGAAGGLLDQFLERIAAAAGADRTTHLEALASSIVVSADGAHATHPNYPDRHEPQHQIAVNAGVVIKRNANQRYATDARTEGWFRLRCAAAGVPVQTYIHRNDLPCGSTIGPITAAELAVPTVDIGAPQLAMHSVRELAGTTDLRHLVTALRAAWDDPVLT